MSSSTCGMDVHSDWTDVTVRRNNDGKIVRSVRRLPNGRILEFLKDNPNISRIAMEASTSAIPLYRELEEAGYDGVLVSHPKKTRLIAESVIKTDRVDSEALSELARLNALPLAWIPDEETAKLREKVRRRAYLVRMMTRMKNKIRMQLLYEGVKTPEFGVFTRKGVEWLHSLNMDSIESYLPVMSVLSEQVARLSKELMSMAPADKDAKLLMTIPGIGYYSALLIKSEVGRIDRFPDGEHLCSYAGLVTSVSQTGRSKRYGPITKQGSSWLRWIMVQCAIIHVRKYDTSITRAYHAIAQSKGTNKARVAAARRLLMCCDSVLRNKRPYYDPTGHYKPDDDDQAK